MKVVQLHFGPADINWDRVEIFPTRFFSCASNSISFMNFKDKVAIVTGASSGIGLATAKLLSQNGAKVVLAARSLLKLQELSKKLPDSLVIQTDMTKEEDIKKMVQQVFKHFGRIDILVNNAGRGYDASIEET